MTIQIGDRFPSTPIVLATADGPLSTTTDSLFGGRNAVLFGVPGAFTPTCSEQHLPGFLDRLEDFGRREIASVVCLAVNDPFVLRAWARQAGSEGRLVMLADGSGALTRQLGLELDLTSRGFGIRAQRFAMVLHDMTVAHLAIEPPGGYGVSSAEQVLATL